MLHKWLCFSPRGSGRQGTSRLTYVGMEKREFMRVKLVCTEEKKCNAVCTYVEKGAGEKKVLVDGCERKLRGGENRYL